MSNTGAETMESQLSFDFDESKKTKQSDRFKTLQSMQDQVERMMAFLLSDLMFLQELHKKLATSAPITEHVGVDWSMAHVGSSLVDFELRLQNMSTMLQRAMDNLDKGQHASTTI